MKKYCKDIDITDWRTIFPFVEDCVHRHWARYDFKDLLKSVGVTDEDFAIHNLAGGILHLSKMAAQMIYERDLSALTPIVIRERLDNTSGKVRQIGCEGALQQILDFIAVGGAKEIFDKRIEYHQASSIKGRGQIYALNIIKGWIHKDNCYIEHCKRHHYHCSPRTKYFVKLDAEKCYPNMRYEYFMNHFRKDCANDDLIWLWESLLKSHRVGNYQGFMIGSLISQWAVQYCMSFGYRFAMSIKKKRDALQQAVSHALIYMDDILMFGSNRKELLSAVRQLTDYMKSDFGIRIKPNFAIHPFDERTPVDMVGFKFHRSGKISVRGRNFIKIRRMLMRYNEFRLMNINFARRFVSYGGFLQYADTTRMNQSYRADEIFVHARYAISVLINNPERRCA